MKYSIKLTKYNYITDSFAIHHISFNKYNNLMIDIDLINPLTNKIVRYYSGSFTVYIKNVIFEHKSEQEEFNKLLLIHSVI